MRYSNALEYLDSKLKEEEVKEQENSDRLLNSINERLNNSSQNEQNNLQNTSKKARKRNNEVYDKLQDHKRFTEELEKEAALNQFKKEMVYQKQLDKLHKSWNNLREKLKKEHEAKLATFMNNKKMVDRVRKTKVKEVTCF